MQPYRLTVEGVIDADTNEVDDVVDTAVEEVTRVKLTISGDEAALAQGMGWKPYWCADCSEPMDLGNKPCMNCSQNNVVPTPLYWATAAEILVDDESETILLRLSLATGGFLQMEVHKSQDGQRLVIHTPQEGIVQGGGETITKLSEGAYEIA